VCRNTFWRSYLHGIDVWCKTVNKEYMYEVVEITFDIGIRSAWPILEAVEP